MKTYRILFILFLAAAPTFAARPKQPAAQPAFASEPVKTLSGVASWYGAERTANGEFSGTRERTAAHKTLPFGTWVRVIDQSSGRSTIVRINDRGPYIKGRVIDLNRAAAKEIGLTSRGICRVKLEILRPAKPARFELAITSPLPAGHAAWLPMALFAGSYRQPAWAL